MNVTTTSATPQMSRSEALALRYGDGTVPPAGPWNEQIAALLSHRSVRGYRSDPLPDGTLETLVAAAQSAATSSNLQVWSVIAVTDADARRELAEIAGGQQHIVQCPLYLVWLADLARNNRLGQSAEVEMQAIPYLETFMLAVIDAALAAQNAVVAAESLGLSTVYIGAMRNDPLRVARLLGLPAGTVGVFGLCVGYAAEGEAGEVKPRLPQATVLHRERYGREDDPDLRAAYDREMNGFRLRNGLPQQTWSELVLARLGRLASMNGREVLKDVVRERGFPLR